jgi:hypothetical protein
MTKHIIIMCCCCCDSALLMLSQTNERTIKKLKECWLWYHLSYVCIYVSYRIVSYYHPLQAMFQILFLLWARPLSDVQSSWKQLIIQSRMKHT